MHRLRLLTNIEEDYVSSIKSIYDHPDNITLKLLANKNYQDMIEYVLNEQTRSLLLMNKNKKVLCVSPGWEKLCQYKNYEIKDDNLCRIQCDKTDKNKLKNFEIELKKNNFANVTVINQKKDKSQFKNNIHKHVVNNIYDEYKLKDEEKPRFISEFNEIL